MLSIADWQSAGDYFEFQGQPIFYKTSGDPASPTLLLIHGFPTASWDYHHLWPQLCEHFQVVTLDMIGFGLSAKPRYHPYSMANQADLYQALLKQLDINHYHILSHDYGDTVAQELLARDKQNESRTIQSVILLNGGLFTEAIRALPIQKLLLGPLGPLIARFTSYKKFKRNFATICARPIAEAELECLWDLMTREDGRKVMPRVIQYMKERVEFRNRWLDALIQAECPIRFINGLLDPISGEKMVKRYRELIPEADVIELPDVGHYPQLEAPDLVMENVLAFWRGNGVV